MGKPRTDPLPEVDFRCSSCGHRWSGAPEASEEAPDRPWHPWAYSAACPHCGGDGEQDPQQRALLKAWAHATGPRTEEGKQASAGNLVGHPTPDEAQITRFNALRHGLHAKVATYFPARPGRYPHCNGCPYRGNECQDNPEPGHENPRACLRRTELYMQHQVAFEQGDPKLLTAKRAETHWLLQAVLDDMILAIVSDGGPRMKEPAWYYDKDGGFHLAGWYERSSENPARKCACGARVPDKEAVCSGCGTFMGASEFHQLYELKEHPMLRPLIQYVDKLGLSLGDMGMTPKVQDEQDLLEGQLARQDREQGSAEGFRERQTQALEDLRELVQRSRERAARDPVVVEHQQGDDDG